MEARSSCAAGTLCQPTAGCAPEDQRAKMSCAKTRRANQLPAAHAGPMAQRRFAAKPVLTKRKLWPSTLRK